MTNRKLVGLLTGCLVATAGTFAARAEARAEPVPELIREVQRQAAESAHAYATSVAPDRNSPEFTAALRARLGGSYESALMQAPPAIKPFLRSIGGVHGKLISFSLSGSSGAVSRISLNLFDFDVRYRENTQSLIVGGDRILGGLPTSRYENTVAVIGANDLCTGTAITQNVVLTAQHCHCRGVNEAVFVGSEFDDTQATYRVRRSVPMRPCDAQRDTAADIALLFLERDFDSSVVPARIATPEQINAATTVRAVGFGRTETGSFGRKMRVDLPVASTQCRGTVQTRDGPAADKDYYGCNTGFELVAGAPLLNRDTCNGDSGGPIFLVEPDGTEWLVGATSRAIATPGSRACGDGGIYVRTDGPVREWLRQQGVRV